MKFNGLISKLSEKKFIFFIFLLSFFVRIAFVIVFGNFDNPEMYEHGKIADNIYQDYGFKMHWPYPSESESRLTEHAQEPPFYTAFIPPLNPYFLAINFKVFGKNSTAYFMIMLFHAILSSITVIVIYLIVREITNSFSHRLLILIAVFNLPEIYSVVTFSGGALYHLFALTFIFFLLRVHNNSKWINFIFAGIFGGGIILLRSEFFLLAPFLVIVLFIINFKKRDLTKSFMQFSVALLIILSIVLPWTVRNHLLFDKFIPVVSHPWHEIWRGSNDQATGGATAKFGKNLWLSDKASPHIIPRLDSIEYNQQFELKADAVFKEEALSYITHHKSEAIVLAFKRLLFLWTIDIYTVREMNPIFIFFIMLVFIPLFYLLINKIVNMKIKLFSSEYIIFVIIILYYSLLIFLVNYESRYKIFVTVMLLPLSVIGLNTIISKILKVKNDR